MTRTNSHQNDSTRAVQYLNLHQDNRTPAQRPVINVEIDMGYSMQRFTNPQTHVEDRMLRQPLFATTTTTTGTPPLTEAQSRARMAEILARASAPRRD